ncbi:ferritin family protein [Thermotoga sp. SG1]|uniref:ferritin-like domain-containing protein n=1 Tax=Thermotoga sp. SG1 TaxID=126739 RepID=UPI000C787332|nr:ferritin family protein [Thermotoga sp. SG1]PLV55760.1 ferritin [Thermotoga sp. SG1]
MKVKDVLTMAIRLEEEGERFYRELSEHFDGEIKRTFLELADQERVHAEIFRNMSDQDLWDEVDSYLSGYAFYEIFPSIDEILKRKDLTLKEILEIAISVEKDSIILYYELKDGLMDSDEQKTVKKIIEQEKEHLRKLLALKREGS